MTKVSIVVPIYNMEKYIRRSIESLQNQTLKEIEIILVNDGSPDNCLSICKEYAEHDDRIIIIDKPNGGISSARNAGVKVARGEYIGFVDPDDWIEHDMYENMYKRISETDSDICICDYIIENKGKIQPMLLNIKKDTLNRKEVFEELILDMIGPPDLNSGSLPIMGSVCRLLISKELIDNKNLIFEGHIKLMEDLIYCIELLLSIEKLVVDRGQYYHYMTNYNSAVNRYREDAVETRENVLKTMNELLAEKKHNKIMKERLNIRYVNLCISLITNVLHRDNNQKISEKIKLISLICNDQELKQIIKSIDTKGYTIRKKIVLFAIKNEIAIYLFLYYSLAIRLR